MSSWMQNIKQYYIYIEYISEYNNIINYKINKYLLPYKLSDISIIVTRNSDNSFNIETLLCNLPMFTYMLYFNNSKHKIPIKKYDIEVPILLNKNEIITTHGIPKIIINTWKTKDIQNTDLNFSINTIKKLNPDYSYIIFDDNECDNFIKTQYESHIYNAYCKIIPGAYKADLWRYCYLYKYGGIYCDIKTVFKTSFDNILNNTNELLLVKDIKDHGIYNGIIACKPNNSLIKLAIDKTVYRIKNNYYGKNNLDITGPSMFEDCFNELYSISSDEYIKNQNNNIKMIKLELQGINEVFIDEDIIIGNRAFSSYYLTCNFTNNTYYANMWENKNVYII